MKHKMTEKTGRRAIGMLLASVLAMSVLAGCESATPMTEAPPETAEDLQQYDEFLDLYGIEEGDGMYLAPEDRVIIW